MPEDKQAGDLYVEINSSAQGASKSLNTIIKKLDTLRKSLTGIDTTNLSKMTQELNNASGSGTGKSKGSTSSSSGGAFGFLNVARWGTTIFMARRLGRVVSEIAQKGADYTETLNLWETAMGTNVTLATEFVEKMNEAYGISEKTLMNAQATFKNMLGGLGNISDQMAYALSEGITQMAVDYASLYNQTFEQAFTKFQAALAGQVRPIRSVSGFDITENTLFQLYQSLGGEKTMRQLTRTEKQLLSILAIFQQMTATGAVGDLNKTMESFANQSRVMAESWQQVLSYAGVLLTYTIQESGLLTYVNGVLIFIGDILKSVAENLGAIQHFADPFQAVTDGALTASEATDQLNGKLLDFDKFRALNESSGSNALGLDEKVLKAFANFDTILGNANMEARNLAENFKIASGFFDENGVFNQEKWDSLVNNISDIAKAIGNILALKLTVGIGKFIVSLFTLERGIKILNATLVTGALYALSKAIELFKDGDYFGGILATTISVTLVGAFVALKLAIRESETQGQGLISVLKAINWSYIKDQLKNILFYFKSINGINWKYIGESIKVIIRTIDVKIFQIISSINWNYISSMLLKIAGAVAKIGVSVASAVGSFLILDNILGNLDGNAKKIASWASIVVGALGAVLGVILAIKGGLKGGLIGASIAGLGVGALLAGIKNLSSKNSKIPAYANGTDRLPDRGTLFMAGEAGAEIVYNTPNGQGGVANVQQIAQATYNGTIQALNDWWGGRNAKGDIPQLREASATGMYQAVTGVAKNYGKTWSKV